MDEYSTEAEKNYFIDDAVIPKGCCVLIIMRVVIGKRFVVKGKSKTRTLTVPGA